MQAHQLGRWEAAVLLARFALEPLGAARAAHSAYGPFIKAKLPGRAARAHKRVVFVVADAELYKSMLSDTETWRNIEISARSNRNAASQRLANGMTTLRGQRHEHYRKLIAPPLKRPAVLATSPAMASIAASQVAAWPLGKPFQLTEAARTMAKHLAIGLLFGDDHERAMPIADMIARAMQASWIVPTPALYRWLKEAEAQERAILDWAEEKRGNQDSQDILSILVNNTDEAGNPAPLELIGGLTSFIFGAAYDTCQNALAWTLILLTQHPQAMAALVAEIDGALGGDLATMDRIGALPQLDWTIKEAMRLFPPVPVQMRKAMRPTMLGGEAVGIGNRVVISALQINRDPTIYVEPDSFRPERWSQIKPSPFQYTTFGAGGHMCPGVAFGMQMMKIALATILSSRSVELSADSSIGYRTRVTLAPVGKVEIILRERGTPVSSARAKGAFRRLFAPPVPA
jgi:cytochrome P450